MSSAMLFATVINSVAYIWNPGGYTGISANSSMTTLGCAPFVSSVGGVPVIATVDLSALNFVPPFSVQ